MDRYTILKWKEGLANFPGSMRDGMKVMRLAKLGVAVVAVLLIIGLVYLSRPNRPKSKPKNLVLTATDAQGNKWAMEYLKNQAIEAFLKEPNKPGQPLTLTVKFTPKPPNLLIEPEITGGAGEKYFPGTLKNSQWQEPPKFALTDPNNKLLQEGQFKYG